MSDHIKPPVEHPDSREPLIDYFTEHALIRARLKARLLTLSYRGFEECIQNLLQAMGYLDVQLTGREFRKQRTNKGGRDLEAVCQTGLTSDRLIVQAKQYIRPVQRRAIDELRGVMQRVGAGHSILVTTGPIARLARIPHEPDRAALAPVRVIDGAELLDLLFRYHIGTWEERDNDTKRFGIDEQYFTYLRTTYPAESLKGKRKQPNRRVSKKANSSRRLTGQADNQGGHMLWRTHALAGISALWMVKLVPGLLTADTLAPVIIGAVLGALLPDLDAAQSKIKSLKVLGIQPFVPVSTLVHRTFGHRGVMHSLLGLFLFSLLALGASPWISLSLSVGLIVGYASHIAMDACTKSGVPLLFPHKTRFWLLPTSFRITTGSFAEEVLLPILAMTALVLCFSYFPTLTSSPHEMLSLLAHSIHFPIAETEKAA